MTLHTFVRFFFALVFTVFYIDSLMRYPQCAEDKREKHILLLKGIKERSKREIGSWPFDCIYASILKYQGLYQRILPIENCCRTCKFPHFSTCQAHYGSSHWVCPVNGLHCIVSCVNKHNPNKSSSYKYKKHRYGYGYGCRYRYYGYRYYRYGFRYGYGGGGGGGGGYGRGYGKRNGTRYETRPKKFGVSNPKCEKLVTQNGKRCTKRLCIPLKL